YVVHKSYLRDLLSEYAHKITEHLRLRGYRAASVIDLFGTASMFTYPIREYREDLFSSRYAGVAAGLGEHGHHGMLLTPQYGVRQLLISIVTDAPFDSDPLYEGAPVCLHCKKCVAACPANAITPERKEKIILEGREFSCGKLLLNKCDWAKKYCLTGDEGPKYNGSQTDIKPPEEVTAENLAEALTHMDELQKDYMLAMEPCFIYCPAGGRGSNSHGN
ncbi:MAG: hypothetical protein PHG48_03700, partial [Eubacteriales bacterium]|nr:hypothetical protein [Eubacteriales bacterium]